MFQADSGKTSSVRVAFVMTLFIVLGSWSYLSIQKEELQPIPESVVVLTLGVGGFKAFQGYNDKPLTKDPPSGNVKPE